MKYIFLRKYAFVLHGTEMYVENMILVSELCCYYICLLYQMWVSAVQEQNMVNRKGVKNIDVKKK